MRAEIYFEYCDLHSIRLLNIDFLTLLCTTQIGLIFVFNLIVGTGALTLPAVIAKAGWLLGSIFIVLLAFISYMTVTFVIETMACANAVNHWRRLQFLKRDRRQQQQQQQQPQSGSHHPSAPFADDNDYDDDDDHDDGYEDSDLADDGQPPMSSDSLEHTPLFSQTSRYYVLDHKIEMGEMAGLFFNDVGRLLFYLCLAIYLYGDLSIYTAVVAKTVRDVIW